MNRLIAVAACALLAGCHSAAPPAAAQSGRTVLRLQADWYPQPEHGGFYAALAKGLYEAEGLDLQILPVGQYTSTFQVVASGRAEFGLGSSDQVLEAVSNGLPVIALGATMQHDPQAVMVHTDSPVKDFPDLEGRTVAAQPGATWFKFLVSKYGLKNVRETPATHSIANFLADPNYIQQIFVTSEPFFVKQAGATYRTLLISKTGYDPYRIFYVDKRFLEKQPEAVRKFVKASIQGWHEYLRDPGPANALILKANPAQKPEQMDFTFAAMRDGNFITGADTSGAAIGSLDPARWAALNEQLTALGIVRHPIDPASAYTTKLLP